MIRFAAAALVATILFVPTFATARQAAAQSSPRIAPAEQNKRLTTQPATQPARRLAPLPLELPKPAFKGTPKNAPPGTRLEPNRDGPRPVFNTVPGVRNVARGKPATASDNEPIIGSVRCVTDGDKEANEGSYVELGPRTQWVQIDLKDKYTLHAIVVWHYHADARVYHDVVIQIADDEDFIENVRTVFNNDHDNSAGQGIGRDLEYWDTFEGKLVPLKGQVARYVRLYSTGSTADDMNHYTEVEVFGLPVK